MGASTSSGGGTDGPWLQGIIPPVCTPLDEDGEVDVASLERLLAFQLDAGVDGLFMLGSSGEAPFLRDDQRDRVVEVTVKVASGRVPVLAGAIDMTTARVVDQARRLAALGADAVVATAPFYTRISRPDELAAHFREVATAVDLPLVVYEIPVAVVTSVPPQVIAELAADNVVRAVKNSSGDLAALRQTVVATADTPGFSVLTGTEQLVDVTLLAGGHGAVPGLANVDPHGFVALYRACRAGRWDEARREQERLMTLLDDAVKAPRRGGGMLGVAGFKAALAMQGVIAGNRVARPQAALDADELAVIGAALERAGLR